MEMLVRAISILSTSLRMISRLRFQFAFSRPGRRWTASFLSDPQEIVILVVDQPPHCLREFSLRAPRYDLWFDFSRGMNCSLSILHVPPRDAPAQGRAHSGHPVLRARRGSERGGNYRARSWRFHFSIRTFRRLAGLR